MEACSSIDPHGSMLDPHSRTNAPQKGSILTIDGSNEKVQIEAYKINWKIAIPLLILGVIPGLIYLAGVTIANYLGGKEVRVQHPNPMESNSHVRDAVFNQQDQHVVTPKDPSGQVTHRRGHQPTTTREREVNSQETNRGQTHTPRQKAKPSRTDRVEISRPSSSQSAIPRESSSRKTKAQSPQQKASRLIDTNIASTNKNISSHLQDESKHQPLGRRTDTGSKKESTHVTDHSAPIPIREGREPRTQEEKIAVNIYMGKRVIEMSKITDESKRPKRIAKMEQMARMLPYSKKAEHGTFQGFLNQMYHNSYKILYG